MLARTVPSMALWAENPRWEPSGANDCIEATVRGCGKGINSSRSGSSTLGYDSTGNTKPEKCGLSCSGIQATSAGSASAATEVPAGRQGATPRVFRTRLVAVRRSSPLSAPVSCHPSYSNCGCLPSAIAASAARSAAAAAALSVEKPIPQSPQPASTLAARAVARAGICFFEIKPTAPHFTTSCSCNCCRCSKCSRKLCSALLLPHPSTRSLLICSSPPAAAAAPIAGVAVAPPQQSTPLLIQQQHELQQQPPSEPVQQHQVQSEDEGRQYRKQQAQPQQDAEDPALLRAMRTHAFLHLVSGAVAGAVSRTATAPLDRLKVMLQLQPSSIPLRHAARVIMHQEVTAKTAVSGAAAEAAALARRSSSVSSGGSESQPGSSQSSLQGQPQQSQQQQHTGRAPGLQSTAGSTSYIRSSGSKNKLLFCGWRGFFRGNLTNCLKVVPETAIKFYTYDLCKHALARRKQQQLMQQQPQQLQQQQMQTQHQLLLQQEPHLQMRERFVCGAAAGVCAQLLIYPMELVKTRLAAYSPGCMYSGVVQCFKAIHQEGGIRRLYRGLAPSLLGVIPYAGIDLAVFESLKEAYIQRMAPSRVQQQQKAEPCSSCNPPSDAPLKQTAPCNDAAAISDAPNAAAVEQQQLGPLVAPQTAGLMGAPGASRRRCCCDAGSSTGPVTPPAFALLLMGGCSSLVGQVVAYPTALIRTRMQVDGSGGKQIQYRSSAAAAAVALKQGGLRGLYRGLGANCCKALPAVSLSWIAYEKTKEAIGWLEGVWSERLAQERHVNAAPMLQQPQSSDAICNTKV